MPQDSENALIEGHDLLAMVRQLPDVLFRCEKRADGRIYWTFNEGRLAEEFHITTKQIEGKPLEELFPGGASDELRQHFEEAFEGRSNVFVSEIDGRFFRHHPQPVYGPDGKVTAVVGFISEVTEMIQAEQLIKELNHEMMQRVLSLNETNAALEEANENLARANQDLDAFAFTVSHDLRAPLTVVQNLAFVLQAKYAGALGDDGTDKVQRIRQAVLRMDHMITDILRFSRASRSPLERSRTDLSKLAREVAAAIPVANTANGRPSPGAHDPRQAAVTWQIEDGLVVHGDAGLLRVLLENLLGNAVKYSAGQPAPCVRLHRVHVEDGVAFEVADNGIGFSAEDAERIFEPFHRLDNASGFSGSGVGLATAQRIVERHGGTIWAEAGDPGARILFTLPSADD